MIGISKETGCPYVKFLTLLQMVMHTEGAHPENVFT
jgi:hypothetical protein